MQVRWAGQGPRRSDPKNKGTERGRIVLRASPADWREFRARSTHLGLGVRLHAELAHVVVDEVMTERVVEQARDLHDPVEACADQDRRDPARHELELLVLLNRVVWAVDKRHQEAVDEVEHVEKVDVRVRHGGLNDTVHALRIRVVVRVEAGCSQSVRTWQQFGHGLCAWTQANARPWYVL